MYLIHGRFFVLSGRMRWLTFAVCSLWFDAVRKRREEKEDEMRTIYCSRNINGKCAQTHRPGVSAETLIISHTLFLAQILRFACWGLFISFRKHIISIYLIWHEIHIPRANARNNWRTLAHHKFIHINALCRLIYSERARVLAILLSLPLIHLVTLTRTACSLT